LRKRVALLQISVSNLEISVSKLKISVSNFEKTVSPDRWTAAARRLPSGIGGVVTEAHGPRGALARQTIAAILRA
jgi:hypothetical protein